MNAKEKITIDGITYIREDIAQTQQNADGKGGKTLVLTKDNINKIFSDVVNSAIKHSDEVLASCNQRKNAIYNTSLILDSCLICAEIQKLYLD